MKSSHRTIVDVVRAHAGRDPDRTAYVFLPEVGEERRLSYGELDRRARALAVRLAGLHLQGERALILLPTGLEYVVALFGCLYAGAIPIPGMPLQRGGAAPWLANVLPSAAPRVAFATETALRHRKNESVPNWDRMAWISTSVERQEDPDCWRPPRLSPQTVAFLQFTSGSTSSPRGVAVSHGNLMHNQRVIQQACHQDRESRAVGWLPFHHDMGLVGTVLQPAYVGGQAILMTAAQFVREPVSWLRVISRFRGTSSAAPNFAYALCARRISPEQKAGLDLHSWTSAVNGAEPVRHDTMQAFVAAFRAYGFRAEAFRPSYGLAESTLMVTGARRARIPSTRVVSAAALERHMVRPPMGDGDCRTVVSCGRPLLRQEVRVVDAVTRRKCASNKVGEIWVRGPSVARGYWDNPPETAATFGYRLKNGQGGFLKTGDLGFISGAELFVTGRVKDLIITRGRNLYPQDIEETAASCDPDVRPTSVAAFSDSAEGEERIIVVAEIERQATTRSREIMSAIREGIAKSCGMNVHAIALLKPGGLEKTTSGKVKRGACRAAYLAGALDAVAVSTQPIGELLAPSRAYVAPRTALERDLCEMWADVLKIPNVGIHDNVIECGADSVHAAQVAVRILQRLHQPISVETLFDAPTVNLLATYLRVPNETPTEHTTPIFLPPSEKAAATSFTQERLWFLDQLEGGGAAYNLACTFDLTGRMDSKALISALRDVVRRHESLRTRFAMQHERLLQIVEACVPITVPRVDLTAVGRADRKRVLAHIGAADADRRFDLSHAPLLRVFLVRLSPHHHALLVTIHHIVSDGWSFGILWRDLSALYEGHRTGAIRALPVLSWRYADYAAWQRRQLPAALERSLNYWCNELAGAPLLELPVDRPRPPTQRFLGRTMAAWISDRTYTALLAWGRRERVTPFAIYLAALAVVLSRHAGQGDVVIGTALANRCRVEVEDLIGNFAATVPLRIDCSDNPTFQTLARRVQHKVLQAHAHGDIPFDRLVDALQHERTLSQPPLAQVLFVLQNTPSSPLHLSGVAVTAVERTSNTAVADLFMSIRETEFGAEVRARYSTDIFDAETVRRLVDHYNVVLGAAVTNPATAVADLPLLTPQEFQELRRWNSTEVQCSDDVCLHGIIERQAARTPDRVAATFDDQQLTYAELMRRADAVAAMLVRRGAGAGSRIGVCCAPSLELIVALLGVQKSGAAYVPIDPDYPTERIHTILRDAAVTIVLTQDRLRPPFAASGDVQMIDVALDAAASISLKAQAEYSGATLYIIYTSGSTGAPKGVQVPHRAVVNLLTCMARALCVGEGDVVPVLASAAFDMSVPELYLALTTGGRIVFVGADRVRNAEALAQLLHLSGATLVHATPTTWRMLLSQGFTGLGLKRVVGAEALSADLCESLLDAAPTLSNYYGPTETTVWSTVHHFTSAREIVTIGRPLANTSVYLLDRRMHVQPVGIAGEIHIGGVGVSDGYVNRPSLTAERFIPDPFSARSGARLYRTGDVGVRLPSGVIRFLGRRDRQVKLRGFRIELEEIEAALARHASVQTCVATIHDDAFGAMALVAYIVPRPQPLGPTTVATSGRPTASELAAFVGERLPAYMVPSAFVWLRELPLTVNGKIDRARLPRPNRCETPSLSAGSPLSAMEDVVAGVWEDVLGVAVRRADTDFFGVGGHSLAATRVMSRVRTGLGIEVPLRVLFEHPTLRGFAAALEGSLRAEGRITSPPIVRHLSHQPVPLSFAQEQLWLVDQLRPGSAAYNIVIAHRLTGPLDYRALRATVAEVTQRQESLRTRFVSVNGVPAQIADLPASRRIPLIDLRSLAPPERDREMARRTAVEAQHSFDLEKGPLFRSALLRLDRMDHLFLVTMHHIISDGWSLAVLGSEITELYDAFSQGHSRRPPPLPVTYADYARWQRDWYGETLDRCLVFWSTKLRGLTDLALPVDRPRCTASSHAARALPVHLSTELTLRLNAVRRAESSTIFMVLLTALQVVLSRLAGQDDVVVGTPVANRHRPEIERIIGCFVNLLAIRVDLGGNPSLRAALARIRGATLEAYAHQDLPFERVVSELNADRRLGRSPIFQTLFVFQNTPARELKLRGLDVRLHVVAVAEAKYDLKFALEEKGGAVVGEVEYDVTLFDPATIDRIVRYWITVLAAMTTDLDLTLSDVRLADDDETERALATWLQSVEDSIDR